MDRTDDYHEGDPAHFWNLPEGKRDELVCLSKRYIDSWTGNSGYKWYDVPADAIRNNMLEADKQDGEVTTTIYDKPRNPLAEEMLVNVDRP